MTCLSTGDKTSPGVVSWGRLGRSAARIDPISFRIIWLFTRSTREFCLVKHGLVQGSTGPGNFQCPTTLHWDLCWVPHGSVFHAEVQVSMGPSVKIQGTGDSLGPMFPPWHPWDPQKLFLLSEMCPWRSWGKHVKQGTLIFPAYRGTPRLPGTHLGKQEKLDRCSWGLSQILHGDSQVHRIRLLKPLEYLLGVTGVCSHLWAACALLQQSK